MGSKSLLIASALVAGLLSLTAVLGAAFEVWWLVTAAAMALLSLVLMVAVDADRRTRALRQYLQRHIVARGAVPAAAGDDAAGDDIIGTVRLLQAQYTGRLDRLHGAVESALEAMERAEGPSSSADQHMVK